MQVQRKWNKNPRNTGIPGKLKALKTNLKKPMKTYNVTGTLLRDVRIDLNKHQNFYAVAQLKGPRGLATVVTHAKKAIAELARRRVGDQVTCYGSHVSPHPGALFSARGVLKPAPAAS